MTEHPQCLNDYLEVFDGPSESSPSLYKLCGLKFPPTIWSTNNTMTVRFVVSSSIEGQVFEANYRKQADCGGNLKGEQGDFTSPGYPSQYPPEFKCVWKIEVPVEFSVVLTFDSFDLEWQWRCERDYIEIFDGPSESSLLLGKYCGSDIPAPINSTSNTMTVRFISDRSHQEKGFAATFKKGSHSLEVLTVYRPPRSDPETDTRLVEELGGFALRPDVLIMGDFNAPLIDWSSLAQE
nr:unnamed protein product [Spirometra erinaceieuropaei]